MSRRAALLLPVLLLSVPALAQDPAAKPKKPKKECRSEPSTGSRIASSTCHTPEEWQAIDAAGKAGANQFMTGVSDSASRTGAGGLGTASVMGLGPH